MPQITQILTDFFINKRESFLILIICGRNNNLSVRRILSNSFISIQKHFLKIGVIREIRVPILIAVLRTNFTVEKFEKK